MNRHHDLVIVGSGSAQMMVDDRFNDRDVAIIESSRWGGTCLNVGCIPTKMFVYAADVAQIAQHAAELGVDVADVSTRWTDIRDRVFGRIDARGPVHHARRSGQDCPNITVYDGDARFVGDRELEIAMADGETRRVTADHVVLGAGARPTEHEVIARSGVPFDTSDTIMRIDQVPERLVIVGSGYIASEFAHVFSAMGSRVTMVVRGDALLRAQDVSVSEAFTQIASKSWNVLLGRAIVGTSHTDGQFTLTLDDGTGLECDRLLVAIGRTPNSDRLQLDAAGVEVRPDGRVITDEYLRTSAPNVWALGDITSLYQLKHVANREAKTVRHNLLNPGDLCPVDHTAVPAAVFTSPQIASVGLTEQAARAAGLDCAVNTHGFDEVAYGWAMEDTTGFCKVIADRTTGLLVGAHVLGPNASLLVQQLAQAMAFRLPVLDLIEKQFWIHPALAEVVENALIGLDLARAQLDYAPQSSKEAAIQ